MKKAWVWVLLLAAAALLLTGCGKKEPDVQTPPESVVTESVPESKPEPESEPESEPETPAVTIENNPACVTRAEELFFDELGAKLVPEEELTPAAAVSNAIVNATVVTVHEADKAHCSVTVRYPNVAAALKAAYDAAPEAADAAWRDTMLAGLAADVNGGKVEMLEKDFVLEIASSGSAMGAILWTEEALDALTGGLYLMQ